MAWAGHIEVCDVDATTLARMLEYMYTDTISDENFLSNGEGVGQLLQASLKYELPELVSICEDRMNLEGTFLQTLEGK